MKCEKGCQDGFISPGFRSKETTQRVFQRRLGTRQNYKKGQVSFQLFSAHQSPEHSHAHFPHMAFILWEPNIPIGLSGASQLLSTGQFVIDAYHGPRTLPRVEFETHCCKSSPAVILCCLSCPHSLWLSFTGRFGLLTSVGWDLALWSLSCVPGT